MRKGILGGSEIKEISEQQGLCFANLKHCMNYELTNWVPPASMLSNTAYVTDLGIHSYIP